MNGGSLEELVADSQSKPDSLPWSTRVRLACDVAKGLKYLHSERVMHRDLTSKVCYFDLITCIHYSWQLLLVLFMNTIFTKEALDTMLTSRRNISYNA